MNASTTKPTAIPQIQPTRGLEESSTAAAGAASASDQKFNLTEDFAQLVFRPMYGWRAA
jgi:hypothetical protein